eukprot:gnl/Trimastix_PCT/1638.p1 GENE.gnl/Trimastix_PCT/1638~~gnl/Trimastix_PCT/1638.p1  ORF type:complete len:604 (+),score=104.28 gnl/Trimastix_PCT/1638:70-1812(+)
MAFQWKQTVLSMLVMFLCRKYLFAPTGDMDPSTGKAYAPFMNMLPQGIELEMTVTITENPLWSQDAKPVWTEKNIRYERGAAALTKNYTLSQDLLDALVANRSIYLHANLCRTQTPAGGHLMRGVPKCFYAKSTLTKPMKHQIEETRNLLTDELTTEEIAERERLANTIDNTVASEASIRLVFDKGGYTPGVVPPHMQQVIRLDRKHRKYWPVFHVDEFWLTADRRIHINETSPAPTIALDFKIQHLFAFQAVWMIQNTFETQAKLGLAPMASELDETKRIILETNSILLISTLTVTMLHSLFDFLAFKNDIAFWKNNRSLRGLSVRTLFLNAGMELVIILYLIDSGETSFMILVSQIIGFGIELWKIKRACVKVVRKPNGGVALKWRRRRSYEKSETRKHDEKASKWLYIVLFTLVIGYSIYALVYQNHKSWYSWLLASMVGTVYTFGFIMMTPQLFINYKMKSVAGMPWKTLVYKFLNTIVDDFGAFVIKMPTLHRIACFRDDVVFLIFLYQWWIYPVDRTRPNEYGQIADPSAIEDQDDDIDSDSEDEEEAQKAPRDEIILQSDNAENETQLRQRTE